MQGLGSGFRVWGLSSSGWGFLEAFFQVWRLGLGVEDSGCRRRGARWLGGSGVFSSESGVICGVSDGGFVRASGVPRGSGASESWGGVYRVRSSVGCRRYGSVCFGEFLGTGIGV